MNELQKPERFDELDQRNAKPEAWLDETLLGLQNAVQDAINADTMELKQRILKSLFSFLSGLSSGNRFNKQNPWKDSEPLPSEMNRPVIY